MTDETPQTPQPIEYTTDRADTVQHADLLNEMHRMYRTTERVENCVWVVGQREMHTIKTRMPGTPGIEYMVATNRYRLFGIPVVETKEEKGHGLYVRAGRVGKW